MGRERMSREEAADGGRGGCVAGVRAQACGGRGVQVLKRLLQAGRCRACVNPDRALPPSSSSRWLRAELAGEQQNRWVRAASGSIGLCT